MSYVAIDLAIPVVLWLVAVRIATLVLPRASAGIRLCAALVAGAWIAVSLFFLLSAFTAFRPAPVVLVLGGLLAVLRTTGIAGFHESLLGSGREVFGELVRRWPSALLLAAAGLVLAAHIVRGLLAPSLAWDDLTYHLLRAARWVQHGGWFVEPAANAWSYYEYAPPAGDAIWAWAFLETGNDSLLVAANVVLWSGTCLAAWEIARMFGRSVRDAALVAGIVGFTPACIGFMPSGYVEPTTLCFFLLSTAFVIRLSAQDSRPADAVLAIAALALAGAIKISNLAFVVPGFVCVGGLVASRRWSRRETSVVCVAGVGVAVATLCGYGWTWWVTGSPSYPIPVDVAGYHLWQGNPWQSQIFMTPQLPESADTVIKMMGRLFVPSSANFARDGQFMNLGPGIALLIVPAMLGLRRLAGTRREFRPAAMFVAISCLLVAASVASPAARNLRTVLGWQVGRFLLVPAAAVVILGAAWSRRSSTLIFSIALAVNLLLAVPLGWARADLVALQSVSAIAAIACVAALVAAAISLRREWPGVTWICGAGAVLAAIMAVQPARSSARYAYFEALANGRAFTLNKDAAMVAGAWHMWQELDQPTSLHIAVAGDWGSMSPLGARYPFLGHRFQNRVVYVPVTPDGSVVDLPSYFANRNAGEFDAWLERLIEQQIDYLAILDPHSIEDRWARQHPDVFVPRLTGGEGPEAIYRFVAPSVPSQ